MKKQVKKKAKGKVKKTAKGGIKRHRSALKEVMNYESKRSKKK